MLSRLTYSFFEDIKEDKVFTKTSLGKPITMPGWAAGILQSIVADSAVVSESMKTPSEKWRGQAWRESSGRWANRGGVAREWYTAFYKAKKQGQEHLDAWLRDNPKPR